MLKPIERTYEDGALLVPNDLLMVDEPDTQQAVEYLTSESRCVPNVSGLQAGHQLEGFRPIGTVVSADRGLGMPLRSVLHIARLGRIIGIGFRPRFAQWRALLAWGGIQASAVAPLTVQLDSVGRVGDHQQRLAVAQEPGHILRLRGVPTQNSMIPA